MSRPLIALILCTTSILLTSCFSKKAGNAEQIGTLISEKKDVVFEGENFDSVVRFVNQTGAVPEAAGIYRQNIAGAVSFRKCIFKDDVIAYISEGGKTYLSSFARQVNFDSCVFYGKVNFRGSTINGLVNFKNCVFLAEANFEEIQCMSGAWFAKSHFDGEVRFHNSYFNRRVNFMDVTFDSTTSFQSSFFNQEAQFSVTKYWQYADFSLCHFNQGVFYNYATFHKRALFNNSTFRERAEFLRTEFKHDLQMKECKFYGRVKFNDMSVQDGLHMGNSVFFMDKPDFSSVKAKVNTDNARFYTGASVN